MAAIEHSTHRRLQVVKIEMRRAKLSDSFVLHILAIEYGGAGDAGRPRSTCAIRDP
jgi:hypothetical protein